VTKIHSAAGQTFGGTLLRARPFRAPHDTASAAALGGRGSGRPRPGEATLAQAVVGKVVRVHPAGHDPAKEHG
jgi:predicted ATPase with chaperone activity